MVGTVKEELLEAVVENTARVPLRCSIDRFSSSLPMNVYWARGHELHAPEEGDSSDDEEMQEGEEQVRLFRLAAAARFEGRTL